MKKKLFYYIILVFGLFLLWSVLVLANKEFSHANVCPTLITIPACYIILVFTTALILAHVKIFKAKSKYIYFIAAGIPWLIAVFGSYQQFLGDLECPKNTSGYPMCYLSLMSFSFLIIMKILEILIERNKK